MPDWFYRTVSQPVLFRLPAQRARDLALGFMGRLAQVPFGPALIVFMGHMRADPGLRQSFLGIDFPTATGLGPWLDTRAVALPALARFGFGFLEVGPVTVEGYVSSRPVERVDDRQAIWFPEAPDSLALDDCASRLTHSSDQGLPMMVRLGYQTGTTPEGLDKACRRMVRELGPHADLFSLATVELFLAQNSKLEIWDAHWGRFLRRRKPFCRLSQCSSA